MSIESAKAFIERIKVDKEFATSVSEFGSKDERMVFVKENGFDFTADELNSLTKEITDEDLSKITGGRLAACRNNPSVG